MGEDEGDEGTEGRAGSDCCSDHSARAAEVVIALLIFAGLFLLAGIFGFCSFCKNFTNEYEHGQFEGGFQYVADQEHDSAGNPLTGWRLELSRRAEQVFNPLCYWPNKWLGREVPPP